MPNRIRSNSTHDQYVNSPSLCLLETQELEKPTKRACSLTKLSRDRSALDTSPRKKPRKGSYSDIFTALVAVVSDAAAKMSQETNESNLKKLSAPEIYLFEPKSDPNIAINHISSMKQRESKESKQEVSIQIAPAQKFCRICLESEESDEKGNLIYPCRCDGSLKNIHEGCLKKWIMQRKQDENSQMYSKCEICFYVYHLEARKTLKFNCSRSLNEGFDNLQLGTALATALAALILGVYKLLVPFLKSKRDPDHPNQLSNWLAIILCSFLCVGFFILTIICLKRAFFEVRIVAFKIYNFEPDYKHAPIESNRLADYDLENVRGGTDDQSRSENLVQVQNQSLNISQQQLLMLNISYIG